MSDIRAALAQAEQPLVIAHRGDWSAAPENSRAAIAAARAFDMVEIDLQLSADGVPMLMHDPTMARTTGRAETLGAHDAATLRTVPLLGGAECIPDLEAAFAAGQGLLFDLDVKEPAEIPRVAETLAAHPARLRAMLKRDVRAPRDIDALLAFEAQTGVTVIAKLLVQSDADVALLRSMAAMGVAGAEIWFDTLARLDAAAATGLPLTTYTLRDVHCLDLTDAAALQAPQAVWGTLCDCGLRGIMTDHPAALKAYLATRGATDAIQDRRA